MRKYTGTVVGGSPRVPGLTEIVVRIDGPDGPRMNDKVELTSRPTDESVGRRLREMLEDITHRQLEELAQHIEHDGPGWPILATLIREVGP